MKISIKESGIVRPAQETPNGSLWLSNLDVIHGQIHFPLVYFYKPDGSSNFFETKLLKEALSKVLVAFYPAAGRLAKDENGRVEINCNGEGVLFVKAEMDCPMSDFGDFTHSTKFMQLVPHVDYSGGISSYPLIVSQVSTFSCGGVCFGIGTSHILTDGLGGAHFINSWAEMSRGLSITNQPFLERTILQARDPPTSTCHHTEYDPPPKISSPTETQISPEPNSFEILKIPRHLIDALKTKINDEGSTVKYSTYEILAAHLWRCTCRARNLSDDQAVKLNVAVDGRSRLFPPIPWGYFGNVIFHATPIASSKDLVSEPIMSTVERIHKALAEMDDNYLKSAIDFMEEPKSFNSASKYAGTCPFPNLSVTSWIRLPFGDADFGWGKPTFMQPAYLSEGMENILPSFTGDGDLSLAICLQNNHMKSFKKLVCMLE